MEERPKHIDLKAAPGLAVGIAQKARSRREGDRAQLERALGRQTGRNDLTPPITFEYRSISALKKAARRVRRAGPGQLDDINNSINAFGLCGAVLINEDGTVINGHSLIAVCEAHGIKEVPCLVIGHLSQKDLRRLHIALNRIQEKGIWDIDVLRVEIKELAVEFGPDFSIPGIEWPELDALLLEDETSQNSELDKLPELAAKIVSQVNDIWQLGPHVIGCGDARDLALVRHLLADRKVRLNFSDLPYNVAIHGHVTGGDHREFVMASGEMTSEQFLSFLVKSLGVIFDAAIDGGLIMLFMDWRGLHTLLEAGQRVGFSLLNIIVWVKTNGGMGSLYRSQHEFIVLFKKGKASHINNVELGRHGRWRSNVWHHAGASSMGSEASSELKNHPTPKPVGLLEDAILDVTDRGELIFDSFAGSGSTLIAAERTGRVFCGTELDAGYVDLIVQRWATITGGEAVLQSTGETFAQVKLRRDQEPALDQEVARKTPPMPGLSVDDSTHAPSFHGLASDVSGGAA